MSLSCYQKSVPYQAVLFVEKFYQVYMPHLTLYVSERSVLFTYILIANICS